jgi:diadenosine tetraphosphate (Ap4A) HIT family hydrolase
VSLLELQPGTEIEPGTVWTVALNRNQHLLGKAMLILRRPCQAVVELTADEWAELHRQLRRLTVALDALFSPDQYNYAFLMNLDAQVHLHVVPRYRHPRQWEGVTFDDPHFGRLFGTEQRILEAATLGQLSQTIRSRLPASA